jgi:hypothetical protein
VSECPIDPAHILHRVLRHEVDQSREARGAAVREARSDMERQAAVKLLQSLTVYSVPTFAGGRDWREWFAGPTTADVIEPRGQRVAELKRLTGSEAELLPRPLRPRPSPPRARQARVASSSWT